jgi:hypothetical protein
MKDRIFNECTFYNNDCPQNEELQLTKSNDEFVSRLVYEYQIRYFFPDSSLTAKSANVKVYHKAPQHSFMRGF